MPIYEYRCESCGHELEAMQKIADAPLTDCPACGSHSALRKKISAVGFRLKGSGWYETDFKGGKDKRNLAKDEGEPNKPKSDAKDKAGDQKSGEQKKSVTSAKQETSSSKTGNASAR